MLFQQEHCDVYTCKRSIAAWALSSGAVYLKHVVLLLFFLLKENGKPCKRFLFSCDEFTRKVHLMWHNSDLSVYGKWLYVVQRIKIVVSISCNSRANVTIHNCWVQFVQYTAQYFLFVCVECAFLISLLTHACIIWVFNFWSIWAFYVF